MSADGSVMGATKMSSKLWTSSDFGVTWAEDATSPVAWVQFDRDLEVSVRFGGEAPLG